MCENLGFMGIKIDAEKNKQRGKELDITGEGGTVKVLVIPTNEELMIARDTQEIVNR
jgi:acetate kinase